MHSNISVQKFAYKLAVSIGVLIPLLLSACGGGSGGDRAGLGAANTSIAGTVTGLLNPLVLQNNGGDNLALTAEGSFAFSTKVAPGAQYTVTVLKQPANQTCTVSNGTGTAGDIVNNIKVNCTVFVLSTTPASESTGIALNTLVSARFSSAIKPETLTLLSFSISGVKDGLTFGVIGAVSLSADKRSAIFTPASPLPSNTRYTATIDTTVQDNNNNNLDSKFTWRFNTGAGSDTTIPAVSDTSPLVNATGVATNSAVMVSFSEAMNPDTLTATTFTLNDASNNTISGSVVTSADNRSATFTPNTALAATTLHTATLTAGVKDIAGNSLVSVNWSFTTGNASNTTAPTLVLVSPAANSLMQPVSTTPFISATFNKPLNCATVSTNSFQVLEEDVPVPGYTECSGTTLRFKPHAGVSLPGSTALTASLSSSIKDLAGNAISAYSWSFGMAPWTRQLGSAANDYANAITRDLNGNVYVAGNTTGVLDGPNNAGGEDLFITKYDSNGAKQWTRQLGTAAEDFANAIISDSNGNVYVAGSTRGTLVGSTNAGGSDLFITKYDSNGAPLWTHQLGSAADDFANAITIDSNGNVYAAGEEWGALDGQASAGLYDLFLTKYDSNGTKQWTRLLGTATDDYAKAITSDSNGNVYVAGYTWGAFDGQTNAGVTDLFITKYDSNGINQWTRQLGATHNEFSKAITSDSNGNVYAAGVTVGALDGQTSAGGGDLFITKYDSSGAKQWTRLHGTAAVDIASAITSDSNGNVYAAGYTNGALDGQTSTGDADLFIVKYDSSGRKR